MSINRVFIMGNLGKDPELRMSAQQMAICNFSLATNERRKNAAGQWEDHTEWHRIVTFGKTAENCHQYLKKGRQAFVEGQIRTNKWKDKEGKDHYSTEIIASNVQFVGGAGGTRNDGSALSSAVESESAPSGFSGPSFEEVAAGKSLMNSLQSADALGGGSPKTTFDDDDIPF